MEDASTHKDCEKEKEVVDSSNARPDVVGVGLMGADIVRLQANVRELRGLSSPVRRSLFGGAGLTPPTPVTHSTPQLPPLQERSQSGLSTDGEFDFNFILFSFYLLKVKTIMMFLEMGWGLEKLMYISSSSMPSSSASSSSCITWAFSIDTLLSFLKLKSF